MAVKCYTDKNKACKEASVLNKIKQLTQNCQGIVPYYGMKKLLIELIFIISLFTFHSELTDTFHLKDIFYFLKNANLICKII